MSVKIVTDMPIKDVLAEIDRTINSADSHPDLPAYAFLQLLRNRILKRYQNAIEETDQP